MCSVSDKYSPKIAYMKRRSAREQFNKGLQSRNKRAGYLHVCLDTIRLDGRGRGRISLESPSCGISIVWSVCALCFILLAGSVALPTGSLLPDSVTRCFLLVSLSFPILLSTTWFCSLLFFHFMDLSLEKDDQCYYCSGYMFNVMKKERKHKSS